MPQKKLAVLSALLLASFAHADTANQPISQSVQPVLITPPALSEAQLQHLLKQLPQSVSALRAGDRVSRMAPAPALSDLYIVRIISNLDQTKWEPIGRNKTSTNGTFSNAPFTVITFEQGYGQSYSSYAAITPSMSDVVLLCNSKS